MLLEGVQEEAEVGLEDLYREPLDQILPISIHTIVICKTNTKCTCTIDANI